MKERYFNMRESWITGRVARRMADAMRACNVPPENQNIALALGLLCRVGFAMLTDNSSSGWTHQDVDEISAPGFAAVLLSAGIATENNGFIELHGIDHDSALDIYKHIHAERMREARQRKKNAQRDHACKTCAPRDHMCAQSDNTQKQENPDCQSRDNTENAACAPRDHACAQGDHMCANNNNTNTNNIKHAQRAQAREEIPGRTLPEIPEDVFIFLKNQAACGLDEASARACAESFFYDSEARGWTLNNGAPMRDWRAAARAYMTKWQNNERNRLTTSRRRTPRPTLDPTEKLSEDAPF